MKRLEPRASQDKLMYQKYLIQSWRLVKPPSKRTRGGTEGSVLSKLTTNGRTHCSLLKPEPRRLKDAQWLSVLDTRPEDRGLITSVVAHNLL